MKYEESYYTWQKEIGILGGTLNLFKFEEFIKDDDTVLDFGSGGGFLLKNINCKEKLGIEINSIARKEAKKNGIKSVRSISEIRDNYSDVIISNHALEHVEKPLDILKELCLKLKENGRIIFVVPFDGAKAIYNPKDINHHLYTWNAQTIGNLFMEAGFKDIKVLKLRSKWPPHYALIYRIFGKKFLLGFSYIYALLKNNYQFKVIARK